MKFNSKQYAQALYEALQETKDHDKVVDNFVKILAQNGDLSKHPEIERYYRNKHNFCARA
jgi:F0F1-type ATP synthase delta subunit